MKDSVSETYSCNRCYACIGKAIFAGIVATILLEVLIYFQGQNSPLMLGSMILGSQVSPTYIYLVGGTVCLLVGIIYAILYALLLAPMHFMPDLIQAIIFAAVMTVIAIFAFPKLQTIVDTVAGRHSQVQMSAQTAIEAGTSTEIVKSEGESEVKTQSPAQESMGMKQMVLLNFMNHLIYAFSVIVVYRRCKRI